MRFKLIFICFAPVLFLSTSATAQEVGGPVPFVLGITQVIHSKVLNEDRTLNIYLPAGFKAGDTTKYAVTYLLDGSADEDFIHISGLYQFDGFEWIHRVPKTIVVGIANTDRRRDLTFPTSVVKEKAAYPEAGHSEAFVNFIKTELQPYIASKYNVTADRTLIGESLGGLLAAQILFEHPEMFTRYIIVSPSIWWDARSILAHNTSLLSDVTTPLSVYIGVGKEGLTPGANPRRQDDDAKSLKDKISQLNRPNIHVFFDHIPDEDHATIGHRAVYDALKLFSAEAIR